MKNILLGSLLSCAMLFSTVTHAETPEYALGVMGGTMGDGIYLRKYISDSYLQVTGIVIYGIDEVYTIDSDTPTEVGHYIASAGASYGHYIFKDHKKLYDWLDYALKMVVGGCVTKTNEDLFFNGYVVNDLRVTAGLGLGIELFSPLEEGLMAEVSVDYGTSKMTLLGLSITAGIGFNF